jgi:hypothetical protein
VVSVRFQTAADDLQRHLIQQIDLTGFALLGIHLNHFIRVIHQRAFLFLMTRFGPFFPASIAFLAGRGLEVPRRGPGGIPRAHWRLFETHHLRFQVSDLVHQFRNQPMQFFS